MIGTLIVKNKASLFSMQTCRHIARPFACIVADAPDKDQLIPKAELELLMAPSLIQFLGFTQGSRCST